MPTFLGLFGAELWLGFMLVNCLFVYFNYLIVLKTKNMEFEPLSRHGTLELDKEQYHIHQHLAGPSWWKTVNKSKTSSTGRLTSCVNRIYLLHQGPCETETG